MPYEIDFLPVGDGSQGGDAIVLRFGPDLTRRDGHKIVIIDGGRTDTGLALVHHVWWVYGATDVDLVINTHPDIDHVGGLRTVIELLDVKVLAMHRPWAHAANVRNLFVSGRLTIGGLATRIRKELEAAHDLEQAALARNIPIVEPFAGDYLAFGNDWLRILGPERPYYESLLCHFDGTPVAKQSLRRLGLPASRQPSGPVFETLDVTTESLRNGGKTSAENNTSVVALLGVDGRRVLFTGDAGEDALVRALLHAQQLGVDPSIVPFDLLQVPHHGSRNNIGPFLLNYVRAINAVISAPPSSTDHPSPSVVNALIRRGTRVHATQGSALRYAWGVGARAGWDSVASPLNFAYLVDS